MKYIVKTKNQKVCIVNGSHPNQALRKSTFAKEDGRIKVYDDLSCWEYVVKNKTTKLLMKYSIGNEQFERDVLLERLKPLGITTDNVEWLPLE
jgi:hypothetical protein